MRARVRSELAVEAQLFAAIETRDFVRREDRQEP
jgi:hypothetical protein